MTLGGTPLVTHAVRRLVATGGVSHVVVVVPASHEDEFADVLSEFADGDVPVEIVAGGAEGLHIYTHNNPDITQDLLSRIGVDNDEH